MRDNEVAPGTSPRNRPSKTTLFEQIRHEMNAPMANPRQPTDRTIAYLALAASLLFGIVGQLLMKSAALNSLIPSSRGLISVGTFMALAVYGLGVVNWIIALRSVNLGVAYSLSSLNYVGIFLGSYFLFDEAITSQRLLGVVLIFVGVLLIVLRAHGGSARSA